MSDTCETVKIASDATKQGFIIINKSAMKDGDKLYSEKPQKRAYNKKVAAQ